jgi:acetoin utilization protein AcuB
MLVRERMSSPVVTLSPDMTVSSAMGLMKENKIRRAPVVEEGEIVGIVSNKDLIEVTPVLQNYLKSWEQKYLESEITVSQVMKTRVITIDEDTPIEEAAKIMSDNKIGGLPVTRNDKLIGMITETDIFRLFVELMGARASGVRVTFVVPDIPGEFARITRRIADENGNIVALTTFEGEDKSTVESTMKVAGIDEKRILELIEDLALKLVDIRVT